jgi:hypothetical protein
MSGRGEQRKSLRKALAITMSIKLPLTNSQNRTQTPTPYIVRLAHRSLIQHPLSDRATL